MLVQLKLMWHNVVFSPSAWLNFIFTANINHIWKIKLINCIQHTLWLLVEFSIFSIANCPFLKDTAELKVSQNKKVAHRNFYNIVTSFCICNLSKGKTSYFMLHGQDLRQWYIFSDSLSKEGNTPWFFSLLSFLPWLHSLEAGNAVLN